MHPDPAIAIAGTTSGSPKLPSAPPWQDVARRLIAYAMRLGASVEEAEDVVQEAILVAVRDPSWHDRQRASLVTALGTVVRNKLTDRWRHDTMRSRKAPHLRLVHGESPSLPDRPLVEAGARARRRAFLAALTPEERGLFRLWLRQRSGELDGPGAAREAGLSYRSYEAAKKRLRRRCRALLDELGLDAGDLFDAGGGR